MKSIGEQIDELILTNIKIWHEDTHLRNCKTLTNREKTGYGMRGRALNAFRSQMKHSINTFFGDALFDERKVNYSAEDKKG